MHKSQSRCASSTESAAEDSSKFYADIANGLHAMAQPLTILRASMEVLALPPSAGVDQKRYMQILAAQLQRTCSLFTRVQDLVSARYVEAQRTGYELWELIAPLIEGQRNGLQASGAAIAVARQGPWERVVGDANRTELAVAALLQMMAEEAQRGDVIEIAGRSRSAFLEITIENSRSHKNLSSSARLSLALAEENILSQQGKYEFTKDPFRVSLALPLEDLESERSGISLHRTRKEALH